MRLARPPLLSLLHRVVSAGSAGLIFALGLFAVSPQLHAQLHHEVDSTAPDQCAIVLFANGVSAPAALAAPAPPVANALERTIARPGEIVLIAPRYALRPERGPPDA